MVLRGKAILHKWITVTIYPTVLCQAQCSVLYMNFPVVLITALPVGTRAVPMQGSEEINEKVQSICGFLRAGYGVGQCKAVENESGFLKNHFLDSFMYYPKPVFVFLLWDLTAHFWTLSSRLIFTLNIWAGTNSTSWFSKMSRKWPSDPPTPTPSPPSSCSEVSSKKHSALFTSFSLKKNVVDVPDPVILKLFQKCYL